MNQRSFLTVIGFIGCIVLWVQPLSAQQIGNKACDAAKICDPSSSDPAVLECCKCHKPCTVVAGVPPVVSEDFKACVEKNETCDPCSKYMDANDKIGYACCSKLRFDESIEKDEFACCRKYFDNTGIRGVKSGYEQQSPAASATKDAVSADINNAKMVYMPPYLGPRDIYKWIYQRCMSHCEPPPPPDVCGSVFSDAGKLACCEDLRAKGVLVNPKTILATLMTLCTTPEDCKNTSIINIGDGATVTGSINVAQCCQVVNMVGSTAGDISNNCPIIGGSAGSAAGASATSSEGASSLPADKTAAATKADSTSSGCSLIRPFRNP